MGMLQEFKDFAIQGNMVDLAVGVIIGGAFGKIVSSMVADVIMPPIGLLMGGVNFTALKFQLKPAGVDAAGKAVEAVTLNYGNFMQVAFDFTIVAACIFMLVKGVNHLRHPKAQKTEASTVVTSETLLAEIRDLLRAQASSGKKVGATKA